MADENQSANNRATVAGVDAKVAGLDAKVDGLANLMRAEFAATRERLNPLADLPSRFAALEEKVKALDMRETASDADMDRRVTAIENNTSQSTARRWAMAVALTGSLVVVGADLIPRLFS